ncbi:MAG: hypothetical protein ABR991_10815, partial [Terracidiphilus sp.]
RSSGPLYPASNLSMSSLSISISVPLQYPGTDAYTEIKTPSSLSSFAAANDGAVCSAHASAAFILGIPGCWRRCVFAFLPALD